MSSADLKSVLAAACHNIVFSSIAVQPCCLQFGSVAWMSGVDNQAMYKAKAFASFLTLRSFQNIL